jgi:hypothetical protein
MLELKSVELIEEQFVGQELKFVFDVRHNVGALRTSVNVALELRVHRQSGKTKGVLAFDDLTADSLDEARLKMADWCGRIGVGLSNVNRIAGDVPTYERKDFVLEEQPSWVRAEYERLAVRFAACSKPDALESSGDILAEMRSERNPLIYLCGAYDMLHNLSYPDE